MKLPILFSLYGWMGFFVMLIGVLLFWQIVVAAVWTWKSRHRN